MAKMRKITAKYITDNLYYMARGDRVTYHGAIYWMECDAIYTPDGEYTGKVDVDNGTLYWISKDRNISGCINGYEYGRVIDGVPYKIIEAR